MKAKKLLTGLCGLAPLCAAITVSHAEEPILLIEDGAPRVEILIAEEPARSVALAAAELQEYLNKMSGAEVAVVHEQGEMPYRIYVGQSPATEAMGIDAEELARDAFIMRTVDDGLVLLGRDDDFTPIEPYSMQLNPDHPDRERLKEEWDAITGDTFGNPRGVFRRNYSQELDLWDEDQRGSLNAVYEFLRGEGVRWYMPGEMGEVVPKKANIALPDVDQVIEPYYPHRYIHFARFGTSPREDVLWYMRQGFSDNTEIQHFSHGLRDVTARGEMKEAHPERYALALGVRQTERNHACLSDEGLFEAAVRFARVMFDHYDLPMVSMMPQDGFMFCECELCEGQNRMDLPREGQHSDYVWGFVDRVAREVYKTHPDRMINCLAYSTFTLPPETIDELSPNVVVGMIHGRGRRFDDPEFRESRIALRDGWREKTDNLFWSWEHYPFTNRSTFTPEYFPQSIVEGLQFMKDDYFGEFIEVATGPFEERGHGLHAPGINHFNLYLTGRFQWDPDQDLDEVLAEYYTLFYGPAADEMQAFIEFSEANRRDMARELELMDEALSLFDAALEKSDPETVYGQRVALVDDYLERMREWRDQLARGRENVPVAEAPRRDGSEMVLDGRLDKEIWEDLPAYPLVDVVTGDEPQAGSWFKVFWDGGDRHGHVVIGIYCDEPDMENLRTTTEEPGDWRVFEGDAVELMLETQAHSYYQLAINAAGAMVDLDRHYGMRNEAWSSLAEVVAHQGDGYWSVEVRLPVTGEETAGDPLHEMAGWEPTAGAPWHMNVGRQRIREGEREWTAWSPTGSNFHDIMRFGKLE